jgi:hypothetical protein
MSQPTLWSDPDEVAAHQERLAGIGAADDHAPDSWKRSARHIVNVWADAAVPFTADDVWETLDAIGVGMPPTPSALGPIIATAARNGTIRKTGRYVPTRHRHRHRDLTEWTGTSVAP